MKLGLQDDLLEPAESDRSAPLTVSVVIPTRNRGSLIRETLERLLAIDGSAMEIVVVDQSTNTETADIVAELSAHDGRLRLVPTETVGSSKARNVGCSSAAGDLVAYLDDDCMAEKG